MNSTRNTTFESIQYRAECRTRVTHQKVNVIGHDAVTEDWMIAVESQGFIPSDHRHFRSFQPASSIGRANGQRDDVVLALEDLFRKVMLLSTLHAGIVHCIGRALKDPPTTGFLNAVVAGPKGPAYNRFFECCEGGP